jgi:benzoyl-CoA reductase/2-hydroxyglutaryl-CoA dehydratase subunit BcrC/BadD/HgdB
MSIRECAMNSAAFAQLKHAYDNRDEAAENAKKAGKIVVGELGADVPDEILLAADIFPVHVYANPEKPLLETDKYLEYAFDPVVRAQFEKIVDGTYARKINYLAVSNSTDVIIRVYLYLRELHRQEPEKDLPEVAFIDWLFTRNRMHQVRNELTADLFKQTVEKWSGKTITDGDIVSAAKICNADRDALRKICSLRRGAEVRLSGTEALVIIGSAFFMDRQKHTELVNALYEEAKSWPVISGPKIYFTGSDQEDLSLYEMIESTGAVITGEDHNWGDRYYDRDFNMDYTPMRAVVDRYMLREFSSKKAFVSQRVEALNRETKEAGAEAVIFYTNIYEEAASWDYPSQKKSLESRGIRTACFPKMQWPAEKNEGLREKMAAFTDSLKGGRN